MIDDVDDVVGTVVAVVDTPLAALTQPSAAVRASLDALLAMLHGTDAGAEACAFGNFMPGPDRIPAVLRR